MVTRQHTVSSTFSSRISSANDQFTERLQFLDSTLERMIQRFEDEYPETRIAPPEHTQASEYAVSETGSLVSSFTNPFGNEGTVSELTPSSTNGVYMNDDEDDRAVRVTMSRQHSDVSLASRHLTQEEGQMHRFGQQIRRDILRPQQEDNLHGTTGHEMEAGHLEKLRERLEAMGGNEIKERVELLGPDAVLQELGTTAEELRVLEQQDPEAFEKFKEAQLAAEQNQGLRPGNYLGACA